MPEEMITIPKSVYEAERKMRFFGIDSSEVYKKKHNIFIGVSITNKKLTAAMAENYLKWAMRNTKEKILVVIADELNIVNYKIFDKYSPGKAENRAKRIGDEFQTLFEKSAKKVGCHNLHIARWREIKKSQDYEELHQKLIKLYQKRQEFRSGVLFFIKKVMRKKGKMIEDTKKVDELASYILAEMPTLLQGITLGEDHYSICIYPTYFASGMSQFIMDIHAGELDVSKDLSVKKIGLIEAWLD